MARTVFELLKYSLLRIFNIEQFCMMNYLHVRSKANLQIIHLHLFTFNTLLNLDKSNLKLSEPLINRS
jgi:hypothetical protein